MDDKKLLKYQIITMMMAPMALDYHYFNYLKAQDDYKSISKKPVEDKVTLLNSIRFELIAYLNWLGRIYYFVRNMNKNGHNIQFSESFKPFRNLWADHRSADAPKKGQSNRLHFQMLANDLGLQFNGEGQCELEILDDENKLVTFNLSKEHEKYKKEVQGMFDILIKN